MAIDSAAPWQWITSEDQLRRREGKSGSIFGKCARTADVIKAGEIVERKVTLRLTKAAVSLGLREFTAG